MKKIILMIALFMGVYTSAVAEGGNETVNNVVDASKYDFSNISWKTLTTYLSLTKEQEMDMANIHSTFVADMNDAAICSDRQLYVHLAVKRDLINSRVVLDKEQYKKYLQLMNFTFTNRGISADR